MSPEQQAVTLAIGKTIRAVSTSSAAEGFYDVRLYFTDGSELYIEGGFYDGTISVRSTTASEPAREGSPPRAPGQLLIDA